MSTGGSRSSTGLQNKFRHFEVADNDKFQQVWEMHTDETSKLVEKVLQADEIIHTQLLGMRWLPPSGDVFAQNKARQGAAATTAAADGGDGDGAQKTEKEASSQRVDQAKVKIMLRLLCDEASFLIDQATHDKIKSMGTKEGLVTKAIPSSTHLESSRRTMSRDSCDTFRRHHDR